jgi:hypothetical protein
LVVNRADGDRFVDVLEIAAIEHAIERLAGSILEFTIGHIRPLH